MLTGLNPGGHFDAVAGSANVAGAAAISWEGSCFSNSGDLEVIWQLE